jgi:hypothetical protein
MPYVLVHQGSVDPGAKHYVANPQIEGAQERGQVIGPTEIELPTRLAPRPLPAAASVKLRMW